MKKYTSLSEITREGRDVTSRMEHPRVLLADDDKRILESVELLLASQCEIVGTVRDGEALLSAVDALLPDVILLDISLPVLNGFRAARRLRKTHPYVKIIFFTIHEEPATLTEALSIGAQGYVLKRCAPSDLLPAIRQVLQDHVYVSPALQQ